MKYFFPPTAPIYNVHRVEGQLKAAMLHFLKKHEDLSLFLLSNFENYGTELTEAPYSGNFKLITLGDAIVAVFVLTRSGNLLIQSSLQEPEPLFSLILESCRQENLPLKGLIGSWYFCHLFWTYLQDVGVIRHETCVMKEVLYSLDLSKVLAGQQPHVRLLKFSDYPLYAPLNETYLQEVGLPQDLTENQRQQNFEQKVHQKVVWGLFLDEQLISMAELNAKAQDLGQLGGVYTHPRQRRKGYSQMVIAKLTHDCKEIHAIRKLIIFTGEDNLAARNMYEKMGAKSIGHFALFFGNALSSGRGLG